MKELRPVQVILLGFLITIFAGSILLTLPIATQSGQATPYIDALFTATTSEGNRSVEKIYSRLVVYM